MTLIWQRLEAFSHGWTAQIVLRLFGLVLFGICAAASWWLHRSVTHPPHHDPSALEYLDAVVAAATWSLGSAFLAFGPALFRLVKLPPRYRHLALLQTGPN